MHYWSWDILFIKLFVTEKKFTTFILLIILCTFSFSNQNDWTAQNMSMNKKLFYKISVELFKNARKSQTSLLEKEFKKNEKNLKLPRIREDEKLDAIQN